MNLNNLSRYEKENNNLFNTSSLCIAENLGIDLKDTIKKVDELLNYIDNNYLAKFEKEFDNFGGVEKLKYFLGGFDFEKLSTDEIYLYSRIISLLIFYGILEDEKIIFEVKKYILDFLKIKINFLDEKKYESYFSAINTIISYSGYFIGKMLLLGEDVRDLVNIINEKMDVFYKDFNGNFEKFNKLDFRKKAVLVSNLKLVNIFNNNKFDYNQFFEKFDINRLEENAYKYLSFLMDYSGFVVDFGSGTIKEDGKYFPSLLSVIEKIYNGNSNLQEDLLYLSSYSAFLNVKVISKEFLSKFENRNINLHQINSYVDNLQNYFSSQIIKVPSIFLKDFIKSLIIRFYDLHLQLEDLSFSIIFFKKFFSKYVYSYLIKVLKDDSLGNDEAKYKEIYSLVSTKSKLGIKLGASIETENINDFNKSKVDAILSKWMSYVESLNDFYIALDLELKKLRKHQETISHMNGISNLFMNINDFLPTNISNILDELQTKLLVSRKELYELFAFLHDIGKANNLKNLYTYNSFNGKLFALSNFALVFFTIFPNEKLKTNNSANELSSISNQVNYKEEISKFIKDNDLQLTEIVNSFNSQLNPVSLLRFFNSDTFNYLFLNKIIEVYNIIPEEKTFSIVNSTLKEELTILLINLLKKTNINIENIDINKFLFALLVFLEKISISYISELTIPHIKYGIDFFAANSDFNYLSWVLLHHNYPNFGQFKEVGLHKGLLKWAELTNNDHLKQIILNLDETKPFPNQEKDFFMVLITSLDIIDALMGNRAYQNSDEFLDLNYLKSFFTPEFINYMENILSNEQLDSPYSNLNKALNILDGMFLDNPNWKIVKEILLKTRRKILSLYKNNETNI